MAFGNEIRDFIDAFKTGAVLKDAYSKRKLAEQAEANRVQIAKDKQASEELKFGAIYDQNERKLEDARNRWKAEYGLKKSGQDATAKYRADALGIQRRRADLAEKNANERSARQKKEDERKAREQRLKEDPTSILDEADGKALPTNVTTETQGIAAAPAKKEPSSRGAGPIRPNDEGVVTPGIMRPRGADPVSLGAALAGGLSYLQNHFGLGGGLQGASGDQKDGARRMFEGEGAVPPEEDQALDAIMDQEDINNGVDPKEISKSLREVNKLKRLYDFHLSRDRPEEANKAAAAMIQKSRGVAAILSMSALDKMKKGDVAGAGADLAEAYNQAPDGRAVEWDPQGMKFIIKDEETGEVVQEGQVTPEQIFSIANGFKDGSAFYRIIMEAAKRDPSFKDPKAEEVKEKEPETLPNYTPEGGQMDEGGREEVVKILINEAKLEDDTPAFAGLSPEDVMMGIGQPAVNAMAELGGMIAHYNSLEPQTAIRLALSLSSPDLTRPDQPEFNFKLISDAPNVMEIQAEDGTRLKLPSRTAGTLIKTAHDGLTPYLQKLYSANEEEQIGSAIRHSQFAEDQAKNEEERKATAKRANERRTKTWKQGSTLEEGIPVNQAKIDASLRRRIKPEKEPNRPPVRQPVRSGIPRQAVSRLDDDIMESIHGPGLSPVIRRR